MVGFPIIGISKISRGPPFSGANCDLLVSGRVKLLRDQTTLQVERSSPRNAGEFVRIREVLGLQKLLGKSSFRNSSTWRMGSQDLDTWLVTMVNASPLNGAIPLINCLSMAYKWGLLTTGSNWDDPPSNPPPKV